MKTNSSIKRFPRAVCRFAVEAIDAAFFVVAHLTLAGILAFGLFWLVMGQCHKSRGQESVWRYGDPRENPTETPKFRDVEANAPIPAEMHLMNTVGSDGAGLCVITAATINGRFQAVPGIEKLLPLARQRPGGYSPDKLAGLLRETIPDEKYASYVGSDPSILAKLSAEGYAIGATMNTGALYGYRPIHHMVSLPHYDSAKNLACVVDNNQPGVFNWMRATEFARRWIDGGTGWAFVWLRRRRVINQIVLVCALGLIAVAAALIVRRRLIDVLPLEAEDSFDD